MTILHEEQKAEEGSVVEGDWAEQEFGGSALGDARLNARLTGLARQLAQQPAGSLPQALVSLGH